MMIKPFRNLHIFRTILVMRVDDGEYDLVHEMNDEILVQHGRIYRVILNELTDEAEKRTKRIARFEFAVHGFSSSQTGYA